MAAATITITIAGRGYDIACDEGQQDHVRHLAAEIDRRASQLAKSLGSVAENRILVMTALLIADELAELKAAADGESEVAERTDARIADGITALTRRLDAIAERLESA